MDLNVGRHRGCDLECGSTSGSNLHIIPHHETATKAPRHLSPSTPWTSPPVRECPSARYHPAMAGPATDSPLVEDMTDALSQIDLEAYAQNYSGRIAIDRLEFIASKCPPLAEEALALAAGRLKQTADTGRYEAVVERLRAINPAHALAAGDAAWVEAVDRKNRAAHDKLEQELKSYKNNLIKESIRMGHSVMAMHYFSVGNLPAAIKSCVRQRDVSTTHRHAESMSLELVRFSVHLGSWSQVESALARIDSIPNRAEDANQPVLWALRGLLSLAQEQYAAAGAAFLSTDYAAPGTPTPSGALALDEFVTLADVTAYTGLCALATYSRAELKALVETNSRFKELLEFHPAMRDLIDSFVWFRYGTTFSLLASLRPVFLLDIWLARHVDALYARIRENSYVQYVDGYRRGWLAKMASCFGKPVDVVEREFCALIDAGKIRAKLDIEQGFFVETSADARADVYGRALDLASSYERSARLLVTNIGLVQGGLDHIVRK
ncbi:26S proteasome subunit RPN7-domain-containing protein [Dipodascopsis tothii]|uniref:26S proteasome subunit RPN7-domain-containing protein n=1 Tax=Dipodascopsis tothii TaxID=44089 RepID=UPI0034CF272A